MAYRYENAKQTQFSSFSTQKQGLPKKQSQKIERSEIRRRRTNPNYTPVVILNAVKDPYVQNKANFGCPTMKKRNEPKMPSLNRKSSIGILANFPPKGYNPGSQKVLLS
jgi:hypothetical protein